MNVHRVGTSPLLSSCWAAGGSVEVPLIGDHTYSSHTERGKVGGYSSIGSDSFIVGREFVKLLSGV